GPITNPGRASIEAALKPAETDYLYYVLETDGKGHFFTDDYDEFLEAKKARR
ncbi:MAG: endolytic transglycosylase MltG, partial [Actinomycetota bacterium]|nr:endolytic transglycosylase MltG [Actinomycetota bacterium]